MTNVTSTIRAISCIEEIRTGHPPLRVLTEDFELFIVKPPRNGIPSYQLINEFLCSALLQIWKIPTPDVAPISVDFDLLNGNFSQRQREQDFDHICFGSKLLPNQSTEYLKNLSVRGNKISNPHDLIKIGLFDIWVENDDRWVENPNLMLVPNSDNKWMIYAIDHAFTFISATPYDRLDPGHGVVLPYNQTILQTVLAKEYWKKMHQNQKNPLKKLFFDWVDDCEKNFRTIVKSVPGSLGFTTGMQNNLYRYLFDKKRNVEVYTDFLRKLS